jgi:hypothetical protein
MSDRTKGREWQYALYGAMWLQQNATRLTIYGASAPSFQKICKPAKGRF